jgi:hypothetical protein
MSGNLTETARDPAVFPGRNEDVNVKYVTCFKAYTLCFISVYTSIRWVLYRSFMIDETFLQCMEVIQSSCAQFAGSFVGSATFCDVSIAKPILCTLDFIVE